MPISALRREPSLESTIVRKEEAVGLVPRDWKRIIESYEWNEGVDSVAPDRVDAQSFRGAMRSQFWRRVVESSGNYKALDDDEERDELYRQFFEVHPKVSASDIRLMRTGQEILGPWTRAGRVAKELAKGFAGRVVTGIPHTVVGTLAAGMEVAGIYGGKALREENIRATSGFLEEKGLQRTSDPHDPIERMAYDLGSGGASLVEGFITRKIAMGRSVAAAALFGFHRNVAVYENARRHGESPLQSIAHSIPAGVFEMGIEYAQFEIFFGLGGGLLKKASVGATTNAAQEFVQDFAGRGIFESSFDPEARDIMANLSIGMESGIIGLLLGGLGGAAGRVHQTMIATDMVTKVGVDPNTDLGRSMIETIMANMEQAANEVAESIGDKVGRAYKATKAEVSRVVREERGEAGFGLDEEAADKRAKEEQEEVSAAMQAEFELSEAKVPGLSEFPLMDALKAEKIIISAEQIQGVKGFSRKNYPKPMQALMGSEFFRKGDAQGTRRGDITDLDLLAERVFTPEGDLYEVGLKIGIDPNVDLPTQLLDALEKEAERWVPPSRRGRKVVAPEVTEAPAPITEEVSPAEAPVAPHEMTKAEFDVEEAKGMGVTWRNATKTKDGRILTSATLDHGDLIAEAEDAGYELAEQPRGWVWGKDRSTYVDVTDLEANDANFHKAYISKAIAEGKPVSPDVLAEYPDLAQAPPAAAAPETSRRPCSRAVTATCVVR